MRLLPAVLLQLLLPLPLATHADDAYDFFPHRPSGWEADDRTIWTNSHLSSIYLVPTDQREHWGMSLPPWDVADLIDGHCARGGCNTTVTLPSAVLAHDNRPPVTGNVTLRLSGRFETSDSYRGTRRDFVEVLKLFLKVMYDPLETEFVRHAGEHGPARNISETGYRPVYTGPKVIRLRVKVNHDSHLPVPFLSVYVDGGTRRPLPRPAGFCKDLAGRRGALLDAMSRKFGKDLVIYRMGCLVPKEKGSTAGPRKGRADDDAECRRKRQRQRHGNTPSRCR
ncbi:uncharacterized protein MAM_04928 [Metarhizium album ARSEF 1941]|uniref:Uncharacterized protein n=1 Tax=Metarhizium album (strain ARSEF 1941) TaxID=1081103 RepID=A0A0B2WMP6_METAS|nr:uncharacterized protein MAM_04928 [Metarhizium album ARSEF 1941]KHN97331.1 hypothetical protein MAM_04928 [Metarhizium album ARSEF 1941]